MNVTISEPSTEHTPLVNRNREVDDHGDDGSDDIDGSDYFEAISGRRVDSVRRESIAADKLSERLLAVDDDDDEMIDRILHETLNVDMDVRLITLSERALASRKATAATEDETTTSPWKNAGGRFYSMTSLCVLAFGLIFSALWIGAEFVGPPNQPVGPYQLIERQVRGVCVCVCAQYIKYVKYCIIFFMGKNESFVEISFLNFLCRIAFNNESVLFCCVVLCCVAWSLSFFTLFYFLGGGRFFWTLHILRRTRFGRVERVC